MLTGSHQMLNQIHIISYPEKINFDRLCQFDKGLEEVFNNAFQTGPSNFKTMVKINFIDISSLISYYFF